MPSKTHDLFARVASNEKGSPGIAALRLVAAPLSMVYGLATMIYHSWHNSNAPKARRLAAPVIGVGNMVVGGAGKTPLCMAIVRALQDMGQQPAVISRGYGGKSKTDVTWVHDGERLLATAAEAGDEPVMMAKELGVPIAVGADRGAVGQAVIERVGPCVLVADDLYQHRKLYRDLNILALDAEHPVANGKVLPRGPLRESARGLRRAQAVVLTRAQDPAAVEAMRRWFGKFLGPIPILACAYRVESLSDLQGQVLSPGQLTGRKVLAFSGLARPDSFETSLQSLGLDLAATQRFDDHHAFSSHEIDALWQEAQNAGAEALVCSQKDAVRLPDEMPPGAVVWVTRLELEFEHQGNELRQLLQAALDNWQGRS